MGNQVDLDSRIVTNLKNVLPTLTVYILCTNIALCTSLTDGKYLYFCIIKPTFPTPIPPIPNPHTLSPLPLEVAGFIS